MTLEELKESIMKDLKMNMSELAFECANNPLLYTKYVHLGGEIKLEIKRSEIKKKQVTTQRWLFYSGKGSGKVSPIIYSSTDIKRVLESDDEIVAIDQRLILLELKKEIIDEAVKAFQQRGFSLKNIIDVKKFEQGGY